MTNTLTSWLLDSDPALSWSLNSLREWGSRCFGPRRLGGAARRQQPLGVRRLSLLRDVCLAVRPGFDVSDSGVGSFVSLEYLHGEMSETQHHVVYDSVE
jgi:hypothetical protein